MNSITKDKMTFTIERQIKCIAREIALRRTVYLKMVRAKRITSQQAEEEIAVMEDVLKTLQQVASGGLVIKALDTAHEVRLWKERKTDNERPK